MDDGDIFYEDTVQKTIIVQEGRHLVTLPATPDAFYKFRTDVASILDVANMAVETGIHSLP